MLISLFRTSGHSMEPEMKDGSFFLASSIPYFFIYPKKGDRIVFKNRDKNIVKKIIKIENRMYFIEGLNKSDSLKLDPIKRNEILGKIIWTF
jgi:signal peptidase I